MISVTRQVLLILDYLFLLRFRYDTEYDSKIRSQVPILSTNPNCRLNTIPSAIAGPCTGSSTILTIVPGDRTWNRTSRSYLESYLEFYFCTTKVRFQARSYLESYFEIVPGIVHGTVLLHYQVRLRERWYLEIVRGIVPGIVPGIVLGIVLLLLHYKRTISGTTVPGIVLRDRTWNRTVNRT